MPHRRDEGVGEMAHLRLDREAWAVSGWPDRVELSGVEAACPGSGRRSRPDRCSRRLVGWPRSTSFNEPSREAEKEVRHARACPAAPPRARRRPRPHRSSTPRDIARALTRIAHEILERNKGADDLVLLGIPTRGVPLARADRRPDRRRRGRRRPGRLARRDDVPRRPAAAPGPGAAAAPRSRAGGIDGKVVVLVDDVLFSGRTIRAALDALNDVGRPRAVRLAVLVDRGHRELPIRADFVGKNLPDLAGRDGPGARSREIDGVDAVHDRRHGDRRRRRPMKRHLLSAGRPDPRRRRAGPRHRRGDALARRPADQEAARRCAAAPSSTCSSRTPPAPGSRSRPPPSGCRADVINFSAKGSSVSKGESLKDTALTLEAMGADAVVIRHGASGAPHRLANSGWIDGRSVVNAGDGTHEHPTQALLDAFTMRRHLRRPGGLDGRRVAIVGDVLHSRVARSNALLLHTLGAEVTLVAPPTLLPVGVETLAVRDVVRPRRGAAQGRRGDDAAGPARADERRVLPDRARVQPPLRPRRPPDGAAARTTRS